MADSGKAVDQKCVTANGAVKCDKCDCSMYPFVAGLVTDTLYRCQQIIEHRCVSCGNETREHMKSPHQKLREMKPLTEMMQ